MVEPAYQEPPVFTEVADGFSLGSGFGAGLGFGFIDGAPNQGRRIRPVSLDSHVAMNLNSEFNSMMISEMQIGAEWTFN